MNGSLEGLRTTRPSYADRSAKGMGGGASARGRAEQEHAVGLARQLLEAGPYSSAPTSMPAQCLLPNIHTHTHPTPPLCPPPCTCDYVQHNRRVVHAACEGPDDVQAACVRHQAVARHAPIGGLHAHHPTKVGGLTYAAACQGQGQKGCGVMCAPEESCCCARSGRHRRAGQQEGRRAGQREGHKAGGARAG